METKECTETEFEPQDLNKCSYIYLYNMKKALEHSPTLDSVMMVENIIKKHSQEYGKYQLWKRLPRKMMYQTFLKILDYLDNSSKIMIDDDGIVFWTYDPETIKKVISQKLILK